MNADEVRALWSKFLSGQKLSEQEEQELIRALRSDRALADELLSDMDLDGLIRESNVDERGAAEFERRFFECVAAEGDASRFIRKVESRVDQEQGRSATRRARTATRRASRRSSPPWAVLLFAAASVMFVAILFAALRDSGHPSAPPRDIVRPPKTQERDRIGADRARARAEEERLAKELAAMEAERQRLEVERKKEQADADRKRTEEELERIAARLREKAAEVAKAQETTRKVDEQVQAPPAPPETPKVKETVATVARLVKADRTRLADADARPGDAVPAGQKIEVDAGGEAILEFVDQTRVVVKADTVIAEVKTAGGKRMKILRGVVRAVVAKQPQGEPMIFETTHGEAVVLGTTLRLIVDRDVKKGTRLEVEEGKVQLKALSGKSAEVITGHFAVAATGTEPVSRRLPVEEILLTANDAKKVGGEWTLVPDDKSSSGRVWEAQTAGARTVDPKSKKVIARAIPSYLSFTFYADAGRDYNVWIRGRCLTNGPLDERFKHDALDLWVETGKAVFTQPCLYFGGAAPETYCLDSYGDYAAYGWRGGSRPEGPGPSDDRLFTNATVRFAKSGMQTLKVALDEGPMRVDLLWLSTSQKHHPTPEMTGPK